MKTYSYLEARVQINTGDLIGVSTGTPTGKVIQAGQVVAGLAWAHITHCAIAFWAAGRLYALEMNAGGNVYKPMSQYADHPMVVCAPPAGTDLSRFDLGVDHITDRHIPYSMADIARIGLRLLPMRLIDTRGWGNDGDADKVCSLLPSLIYRTLGGDVSAIPKLAAPAEVVSALLVRFEIA